MIGVIAIIALLLVLKIDSVLADDITGGRSGTDGTIEGGGSYTDGTIEGGRSYTEGTIDGGREVRTSLPHSQTNVTAIIADQDSTWFIK